jgi:hypothetical protein
MSALNSHILQERVRSNLSRSVDYSNPSSYLSNVRKEINKIKKNNENLNHKLNDSIDDNRMNDLIEKNIKLTNNYERKKNLKNNSITVNNNMTSVTIDSDMPKNEFDFKSLTYEDIQVNLRLITDLKKGEKLMIKDDRYIVVDDRFGSSFWRYFSDDSRIRSLDFISHIISETGRYCGDAVKSIGFGKDKKVHMEKLINMQSLLVSVQTGLSRLSETYSDDKLSRAKIDTIKKTIDTFKDQDLKKAIT